MRVGVREAARLVCGRIGTSVLRVAAVKVYLLLVVLVTVLVTVLVVVVALVVVIVLIVVVMIVVAVILVVLKVLVLHLVGVEVEVLLLLKASGRRACGLGRLVHLLGLRVDQLVARAWRPVDCVRVHARLLQLARLAKRRPSCAPKA